MHLALLDAQDSHLHVTLLVTILSSVMGLIITE
jgi:hypothetical protein